MDAFQLIQKFFTTMQCQHCTASFSQKDVELIRKEDNVYVVNVFCHQCETQNGVAMVGVDTKQLEEAGIDPADVDLDSIQAFDLDDDDPAMRVRQDYGLTDPELTEDEIDRLSIYEPVSDDDVIEAHRFIQSLDAGWMKLIPADLKLNVSLEEAFSLSEKSEESGKTA